MARSSHRPSGRSRRGIGGLIPGRALMTAGGPRREGFVLRPWPARRARWARRLVVAFVLLAPIVATAATWWGVSVEQTNVVLAPVERQGESVLTVEATALNLDLARREMVFRLVFRPAGDLVDGDELTDDVRLVVNDISGNGILSFPEGSTMNPATVAVPLKGSLLLRYPFDDYQAQLVLGATAGTSPREELPLDLSLTASLDNFGVSATAERAVNSVEADMELGRRGAVVFWVVFFMVLVWAIALGCAAMAWFTIVYAKEPPIWLYAFFAAILFALPTLRMGLPGDPPYGSLVDWAAFYWGVALVAVSLVALLVLWNMEARARLRSAVQSDAAREAARGSAAAPATGENQADRTTPLP